VIVKHTIITVIHCFAPSHLPAAADTGCSSTKVTKKRDTARLRSSGVVPISALNPGSKSQLHLTPSIAQRLPCVSAFPMLDRSNPLKRYRSDRNGSKAISIFRLTRRDMDLGPNSSVTLEPFSAPSSAKPLSDPYFVLSELRVRSQRRMVPMLTARLVTRKIFEERWKMT
jgi:hypothetical protein